MFLKPEQLEYEWDRMISAENAFLRRSRNERTAFWQKSLEKIVPKQLEQTLFTAFCKAFTLILDNGTVWLEKTYDPEKIKEDRRILEYAAEVRSSQNGLQDFRKNIRKSRQVNTMISAAEGIGMGALGIGIADIPLLLAVVLRSVYETALHYGFSYDTEEDQIFILKLMETALLHGDALEEENALINRSIYQGKFPEISRKSQIESTSDALASDVLYLKFVQGIPIVGIVGGVSDIICHQKISDYAELKYRRRYLRNHQNQ